MSVFEDPAQLAHRLGMRVSESNGLHVKAVLRDGIAEKAGFAAGDEWLGVEPASGRERSAWRLSRLDELPLYLARSSSATALIARDKRLLRLPLRIPKDDKTLRLTATDKLKLDHWLDA